MLLKYKQIFLLIACSVFTHLAIAETVQYGQVLKSLNDHPVTTIRLLNQFHKESGPVFRSTFLLATLFQKRKDHDRALFILSLVPFNERGKEYYVAKLVSYKALKLLHKGKDHNGFDSRDVFIAMNVIIENTSRYPDGLAADLFQTLDLFPNKEIMSTLCSNLQINQDTHCK